MNLVNHTMVRYLHLNFTLKHFILLFDLTYFQVLSLPVYSLIHHLIHANHQNQKNFTLNLHSIIYLLLFDTIVDDLKTINL